MECKTICYEKIGKFCTITPIFVLDDGQVIAIVHGYSDSTIKELQYFSYPFVVLFSLWTPVGMIVHWSQISEGDIFEGGPAVDAIVRAL